MLSNIRNRGYKADRRLLAAFGVLIFLTLSIGAIAISQIQRLSRRMEELGRHSLILEKAVLQMQIDNTSYAMGIRNYVFWKVSRYLGALPMAINPENILKAEADFSRQLEIYRRHSSSLRQEKLARQARAYLKELSALGAKIIEAIDQRPDAQADEVIKSQLMAFENQLYKINSFLNDVMGRENLNNIEEQLLSAQKDKNAAIVFLGLILSAAVASSNVIALTVYRRRKKDFLYRRELFNRMMNIEENQRKTLSAEIHDTLGQSLSALKISLGIIEQNMENTPADLKNRLAQAKKITAEIIDKSHNIAYLLRPPALDEVGLAESIEGLLLDYKHLSGINYVYRKAAEEWNISSEYNLLLYRISQELLNNAAKYSQAKNIRMSLEKKGGGVEFLYEDDGIGFKYDEMFSLPKRRREDRFKLGLVGLRERVEMLDGLMQVDTAPGKGTRVKVRLKV